MSVREVRKKEPMLMIEGMSVDLDEAQFMNSTVEQNKELVGHCGGEENVRGQIRVVGKR